MTYDDDRDRIELPEDEATDSDAGGYPPMPPLDAVDPDLEQEGERPAEADAGWAGAAQVARGERTTDEESGSS